MVGDEDALVDVQVRDDGEAQTPGWNWGFSSLCRLLPSDFWDLVKCCGMTERAGAGESSLGISSC